MNTAANILNTLLNVAAQVLLATQVYLFCRAFASLYRLRARWRTHHTLVLFLSMCVALLFSVDTMIVLRYGKNSFEDNALPLAVCSIVIATILLYSSVRCANEPLPFAPVHELPNASTGAQIEPREAAR